MRRLGLLAIALVLSMVTLGGALSTESAVAAVTKLPVVLLVQQSYFVSEPDGCRVAVDDQKQVLLKINNPEGQRRGGAWFAKGELVSATGPSGVSQTYCGFVKNADVETTGQAIFILHGTFLLSLDLTDYQTDDHLVLEVNDMGLVADEFVSPSEVSAWGLEPRESAENSEDQNSTGKSVTRSTRTSRSVLVSPSPTPEPMDSDLGQGRQSDGTYKIVGFLELTDPDVLYRGGKCDGQYGYSDVYDGKQFVVRDGDGRILGVGELFTLDASVNGFQCVYGFEIVVQESRFYVISSSDQRGELVYTHQELVDYDWIIWLSLGDD